MLMLIGDRPPPPEPVRERRAWEPNWAVVLWLAVAALLGFATAHAHGALELVLLLAAFAAGCRALAVAVPYPSGLREWRQ
jgi:hypothetical protein